MQNGTGAGGELPGRFPLQPNVDSRGVPVIGFVEDVHEAVAVEVGDAGFVEADAGREFGFAKGADAVAAVGDDLGMSGVFDQVSGGDASTEIGEANGVELVAFEVFEPVVAGEEI